MPKLRGYLLKSSLGTFSAEHRNQLLAEAIPALSLPVGSGNTSIFNTFGSVRNFNMPALYVPNPIGWPNGESSSTPNWYHSNMREVAYPFLWPLYDQFVTISNPSP
jgi:hypothetical protein